MRDGLRWIAAGVVAACIGSLGPTQGALAADTGLPFQRLYLLSFNRWGDLASAAERDLAINELRGNQDVDRIIIFSYGWANDAESSYATYREMLEEIASKWRSPERAARTAVIAVGWDSSQTGFRKLFNDLIPLPGVANALAWLPDTLLFPISFWSKAAQADRIGFGGLRITLNQIFRAVYEGREDPPEIFLIGHSFGTRILSALMKTRLGVVPVRTEPFIGAEHVKGAVLTQPALVLANLHHDTDYPILITMSEHDHANGFLFPIANIPLNAFGFSAFEALIRHQVLEFVEGTVGSTMKTMTDIVTAPLPGGGDDDTELQDESEPQVERTRALPSRAAYLARRTLAELVAIPASLAFTLAVAPANYVYSQIHGLVTHPVDHLMDSLAQLPVIEIPVYAIDRAVGRDLAWGQRGKGVFNLGPLYESVGRLVTPAVIARARLPVYSPDELEDFGRASDGCGLPNCRGIFVVDASELIRKGAFGENLENRFVNFTLGWLDPVGAHGDYRNSEVIGLMALVTEAGAANPTPD
jgi:hypothetical protein